MKPFLRLQLSSLMFLEFFIWGAWFVTMGTYLTKSLGATDAENGMAYGTQSLGAIVAPFIVGLIADRFFSAQRILAVLHLAGGGLMYFISKQSDFVSFYPYLLAYMVLFMPTLALANSVSFRQLTNSEKEFSSLRVWGTIGWIAAGLTIGWLSWEKNNSLVNTFLLASLTSFALGLLCFFLPDTPPASKGKKIDIHAILGTDALSLLKDKNFLIFFISSMLICIPLAFYYQEANKFLNEINLSNAAAKMTLGQASETLFMILMPFFFSRFGIKKMLLIGMGAWALRYFLFSFGGVTDSTVSFLYLGILLHGICYDFFFVTGQIYTDKRAGEEYKSAAQGLITLATYGVGMFVGFWVAGQIVGNYKTEAGHNWQTIWMIPTAIAAALAVLFSLFFKEDTASARS